MPAGTHNKELTPGNLFSDRNAAMYVYLGYYRDISSGQDGYLYAGPISTPSMAHFGTPTAPDRELMDYGLQDRAYLLGGIRKTVKHGKFRFTKHPIHFHRLEKTIARPVIEEVLHVPGYDRISDRK